MTRSGRHSTRAACLSARPEVTRASMPTPPRAAGSISRTNRVLSGVADAGAGITPHRHAVGRREGRAPARAKARDRAPAAPRGRPARRGARVLGGPVPSTLFVIHEIPRATGCCASGRRTRPPLISWLFSGRWVRSSLTSWALGGESFVYLLYLPPPTRASSLGVA